MPGIKIHTSGDWVTYEDHVTEEKSGGHPLKIMIAANFSGRAQSAQDGATTSKSKLIRIDKDNFDQVFSKFGIKLYFPGIEDRVEFSEFDQLNAEHLYEHLSVFEHFRRYIRNLRKPERFMSAVEELKQHGVIDCSEANDADEPTPADAHLQPEQLLDSILSSSTSNSPEPFSVEKLIQQAIAPYVEEKAHPQVDEYVQAVEEAAACTMRALLGSKAFSGLEANWRSLDMLNRRLDTDNECHLYIYDISLREIEEQAGSSLTELNQSSFYKVCVDDQSVAGGQAFDLVVLGDCLDLTGPFDAGVKLLSEISQSCGAHIVAGIDLTGFAIGAISELNDSQCPSLIENPELQRLKSAVGNGAFFVAAPRVLTRLPYGGRTRPLEGLRFEEISDPRNLKEFAWCSSAYLVALAISTNGIGRNLGLIQLENMPLYYANDEDGDVFIVPTTEDYLNEHALNNLYNAGLIAVQSVKNSDSVLINRWVEFSDTASD